MIAKLGVREDDIVHHHLFRDTQIGGDALIALILRTMATHAIVGEGLQTILHGRLVGQIDIDLIQMYRRAGRESEGRQNCKNQCSKLLFHQPSTLSGTTLVFSSLV